jgi:hypothetical protein
MAEVNKVWISRAQDILKALGLTPTQNRMGFMYAWMAGENTRARNNPLATTWNMASVDPGQTNFNSVPVRNYSSWDIGLKATVNTIKLAYYKSIRDFLAADRPMNEGKSTLAAAFNTWGTGVLPFTIYAGWSPEFKKKLSSGLMLSGGMLLLIGLGYFFLRSRRSSKN